MASGNLLRPDLRLLVVGALGFLGSLAGCGWPGPGAGQLSGDAGGLARHMEAARKITLRTGERDPAKIARVMAATEADVRSLAGQLSVTSSGGDDGLEWWRGRGAPLHLPPSAEATWNDVEVLVDPERIFPAIEEAVRTARRRVQADLFLLGGRVGTGLAKAMGDRRRSGVDVRVILDPHLGAVGPTRDQVASSVATLLAEGVPVRTFPISALAVPPGPLGRTALIDHDKIVVVDDTAFIGSANLIDLAETNHDLMFRVRGPVANEVAGWLDLTWDAADSLEGRSGAGGAPDFPGNQSRTGRNSTQPSAILSHTSASPDSPAIPPALARLTRTDAREQSTEERLHQNLGRASKVSIAVFEMDEPHWLTELIAAKSRGANVRVLLDRHQFDAKYTGKTMPTGIPNWLAVRDLLDGGVPVRWFDPDRPDQEMHLKMALFDDRVALVGSTNHTTRAFRNFRETGLELQGGPAVAGLVTMFEEDWARRSTPIRSLTLYQEAIASTIAFLDRHGIGWW